MQRNLFTDFEPILEIPKPTHIPINSNSIFYHGDCLIEMDKIADKSIDMILCDLPYGTTACKWDIIIPFDKLWAQYERIIKQNGAIVLTASQPFTSALVMSNPKIFRYEWIWHKQTASNFACAKYQPLKEHENITVFSKYKHLYNPIKEERKGSGLIRLKSGYKSNGTRTELTGMLGNRIGKIYDELKYPSSIQFFKNKGNEEKLHPTQKPIALMEYLIKTYTNEGDTVLDNCMGSGTSGVACRNTNRHFIGIEQDKKYFDIAVKRVSGY